MDDAVLMAFCTCPSAEVAEKLAQTLVSEGLAACVNRVGGVSSTYFWEGRLQDDAEILLIIKTTAGALAPLTARLRALHPYELPELIAIQAAGGNEAYLEWVRTGVRTQGKR
jgi:periplasmic divalent cation tolerance protein